MFDNVYDYKPEFIYVKVSAKYSEGLYDGIRSCYNMLDVPIFVTGSLHIGARIISDEMYGDTLQSGGLDEVIGFWKGDEAVIMTCALQGVDNVRDFVRSGGQAVEHI